MKNSWTKEEFEALSKDEQIRVLKRVIRQEKKYSKAILGAIGIREED